MVIGLSLEVLKSIQQAEEQAEAVRTDALKEAREIVKATETACAQMERSAASEARALYQQLMETHRGEVQRKLDEAAQRNAQERAAQCERAAANLEAAAKMILRQVVSERTMTDGHR